MIKKDNSTSLILIKRLYSYIPKSRRKSLYFLFLLMLLSALFEILTLSTLIPFLAIVFNPEKLFSNPIGLFLSKIFFIKADNLAFYIFLLFVLTIIFSGFVRIFTLFTTFKISGKIGYSLSNKFYRNIIYQTYDDHLINNTSESLSSMTYHLDETISVISSSLVFLINFIIAISIIFTLSLVNFYITFLSAVIIISFYIFISLITNKAMRFSSSFIENAVNNQFSIVQESLYSIKDIILGSKQSYFTESFKDNENIKRNKIALVLFLSNFPKLSLEILILLIFALIGFTFFDSSADNTKIISLIGVFALGVQKLLPNFQACYSSLSQIRARSASVKNVLNVLQRENSSWKENLLLKRFKFKELFLKNVNYKYKKNSEYTIYGLSLTIKRGDKIGIIGASGSGKSTLVDILMGLLKPTNGSILINGKTLGNFSNNSFLDSWRGSIGHVPQEIFMTNNTIAENIAFGLDKKDIDIKKLKKAAKLAGISNVIEKTEMKYETCFGEDGVKLSGGQKQRVAIARALYNQPQILILDEATSSLDVDTEKYILESIKSLPKNITLVLISHRSSNLEICDNIYKFDIQRKLILM